MRFLADESCDFAVVRALRAAGFDVSAIVEISPGAADEKVLQMAVAESRFLLTEDKDFGQLAFAGMSGHGGVILIRYPANARMTMTQTVVNMVKKYGNRMKGRFVVVQPGRIRLSELRK